MAEEIKVRIDGDATGAVRATEQTGDALGRMKRKTEETADTMEKSTGRMRDAFTRLSSSLQSLGMTLAVGLTAPILAVGYAVSKSAMNAVESENLFKEVFKGMADQGRAWSVELRKELGLNDYELRRQAGTFYAMFNSMQMGAKTSFELSTGLTKLAYDMASFYNIKPEEAFLKLRAGIMGEIEPLRQLGVVLLEEQVKEAAVRKGIIATGQELTEQGKIWTRYQMIMEQTKDAQGDLARTMDSPTNRLRVMKEQLTLTATELGMKLMPTIQAAIEFMKVWADRIGKLAEWFNNLSQANQELIIKILAATAAIGPFIGIIGKLMETLITLKEITIGLGIATETMSNGAIAKLALLRLAWLGVAAAVIYAGTQIANAPSTKAAAADESKRWTGNDPVDASAQVAAAAAADKARTDAEKDRRGRFSSGIANMPPDDLALAGAGKKGHKGKSEFMEAAKDELRELKDGYDAFHKMSYEAEAEFWRKKLALVAKGSEDYVDILHLIRAAEKEGQKEALEIKLAQLEAERDVVNASAEQRLAAQRKITAEIKKAYGEESKEFIKAKQEQTRAEAEFQTERRRIANEAAQLRIQISKTDVDIEQMKYDRLAQIGAISETARLRHAADAMRQKWELDRQDIERQLQDQDLTVENRRQLYTQLAQVDDEYRRSKAQLDNQIEMSQMQIRVDAVNQMKSGFEQGLTDMISGAKTFGDAWQAILQGINQAFSQMIARMVNNALFEQLLGGLFGGDKDKDGKKKGGTGDAGGAASIAKSVAQATAEVTAVAAIKSAGRAVELAAVKAHAAAVLATGTAAATATVAATSAAFAATLAMITSMAAAIAAIPPDGPAMAAAMTTGVTAATGMLTAATTAATAAIGAAGSAGAGAVALDVGAYNVPQDMFARIHKGETVVPATFAEGMRENGGFGGGGGDIYQISISSIDAKSVKDLFMGNGSALVRALAAQKRQFSPGVR